MSSLANPVVRTHAVALITQTELLSAHTTHPTRPEIARKQHIFRLNSLLHHLLSLPPTPATSDRLLRTFRLLARCPEIDSSRRWELGLKIIRNGRSDYDELDEEERSTRRQVDWIRAALPNRDQIARLEAIALQLADSGQFSQALAEIETYLPAHPYHDSIQLNLLAGLLSLFLAQPPPDDDDSSSSDDSDDGRPTPRPQATSAQPVPTTFPVPLSGLLKESARRSPRLFSQAVQHFSNAARLEKAEPTLSRGEGARWVSVFSAEGFEGSGRIGGALLEDSDSE